VDLIALTLNHGLFVLRTASDLATAQSVLAEWRPHLAVVDMDHDDSAAFLQEVGASNALTRTTTPVLGLTRRGDLATKLKAFDLGVDDILTVPFSPEELLARSIVITRRATGTDRPIVPTIALGGLEIDIINRQVRDGVQLMSIKQSLIYHLASRAGRVVTRDQILDAIWGTDYVAESNIVDYHVGSLHKTPVRLPPPAFHRYGPGRGLPFSSDGLEHRMDRLTPSARCLEAGTPLPPALWWGRDRSLRPLRSYAGA
jgi:DNA-binding response OmpR family regulator